MNKRLKTIFDDVSAIKSGLRLGISDEVSRESLFFLVGITMGRLEGLIETIKQMMEND